MNTRFLAALGICFALAGCASTPAPDETRQAIRTCGTGQESGACRQLAVMLATSQLPNALEPEAEEAVLKACWADKLVDMRQGTDARWRLCYEAGKHFSARAVKAMEVPDTSFRKVAAHLYLRACELGQPQGCRLLISECLLLDEAMCHTPPSEEQARQWAAERRERDARARQN